MAKGLYIEGRKIASFNDIIRNYNHEISFSNTNEFLGTEWGDEDFTLRARSFSLPSRGNDVIESNFGGMKQYFPGKPTFGSTIQVKFEETESQKVQKFLYTWQQYLFDIRKGHSTYNRKRSTQGAQGICEAITITSFGADGDELPNKYFLQNAWLKDVEEVTIDYSQSEAIVYNATFQFDFWTFGPNIGTFGDTATDTFTTDTIEPKADGGNSSSTPAPATASEIGNG